MDAVAGMLGRLDPLSQYFLSLPLQPVFNVAHFILTALALRSEPGKGRVRVWGGKGNRRGCIQARSIMAI